MYAKPLNFIGNLTALSIFVAAGRVSFLLAILMSVGSFWGGRFGASLVIYKNSKWLKAVFVILMAITTTATFIKYY